MRAQGAFATSEVTSLESSYARIFRDDTALSGPSGLFVSGAFNEDARLLMARGDPVLEKKWPKVLKVAEF
jgi:hypothetical protein